MHRPSQKAKRIVSRIFWRDKSGQALIEFTGVIVILLLLIFGAIDFCRAIYLRQVLVNLSRETANLEARGTGSTTREIMTNALNAAIQEALPLALDSADGKVIVTAVTNNFGSGKKPTASFAISQQYTAGTLAGTKSAIGTGSNTTAWLPVTTILPANRTVYVAEVYYQFVPITPVGKLINAALPKQFYDVAYFSAL